MKQLILVFCLLLLASCSHLPNTADTQPNKKIRVLIIDGQNNHTVWPKATMMMKQYLEETELFTVDISRTAFTWKASDRLDNYPLNDGVARMGVDEPKTDPNFSPNFSQYDVVVSNFGWKAASWPRQTEKNLESFVENGGGLVVIHAADNSWPKWTAFNQMIGLGGWGGRNESDGPYVYYNNEGQLIRDTSPGKCGSHGPQHNFLIEVRDESHPIVKGMPKKWLHAKDELYAHLRGPAENMTVLASAYSSPDFKGTDRHEPILMVLDYGKGRIFHSTLGHEDYSLEGVGFITSFKRGTQWAASGKVTLPIPADFPSATESRSRSFIDKK